MKKKKEHDIEVTSFEAQTLDGVVTRVPINDDTSYCYACLIRNHDSDESVIGFSLTFDGLQRVAMLYIDTLTMIGKERYHYAGFERWSSRQMATFLQRHIEQNVVSVIALYGIFYDDEISVIITPQNIVMHERDLE